MICIKADIITIYNHSNNSKTKMLRYIYSKFQITWIDILEACNQLQYNLWPKNNDTFQYTCLCVLTEYPLIINILDNKPDTSWEHTHQNMQIKEEGDPCGGLMLRHRGYDRYMYLSITCVIQGIEPTTPRCYITWKHKHITCCI